MYRMTYEDELYLVPSCSLYCSAFEMVVNQNRTFGRFYISSFFFLRLVVLFSPVTESPAFYSVFW